jgi:alpha-L-rhamnosidase
MDTAAFRKIVRPKKDVKEAWWSVTGLGVFEAYVNGEPVSRKTPCGKKVRDFLKPGFTHARKCRHAFTYDVTHLFKTDEKSENVLSAFVSQGWWRDQITGRVGKESAFRAQLVLKYEDGTQEVVGTDSSWLSTYAGPVIQASIFDGEKYDARINTSWMKGGELDGSWSASKVNTEFKGDIRNFVGTPIRMREDLALAPQTVKVMKGVKDVTEEAYGVALVAREYKTDEVIELNPDEELVIDFAQNAAAIDSFTVDGTAGTVLTIRHCEMLNEGGGLKSRGNDGPEGIPYVRNLRGAPTKVTYILKDGVQSYHPEFTFFGYRYIGVKTTSKVKINKIRSIPVTSISCKNIETGYIETDNPLLNRLIKNVIWGQYSNYLSVPTDCPQRNERLGWTADTQVFAETACYNANVCGFLNKYMQDMVDSQHDDGSYTGVAPLAQYGNDGHRHCWADAGIIVPYTVWKQFGDSSILLKNWESMKKYMKFVDETKFASPKAMTYQWADWLSYEKLESAGGGAFEFKTDKKGKRIRVPKKDALTYWKYLGACYWHWDAMMMATMARAINKPSEAAEYDSMAKRAMDYLRENFIEKKDGMLLEVFRDMQTPALLAIKFGIITDMQAFEKTRNALLKNIKDHGDCLQTGFLGTSILMDTLTYEAKAPEVAYTLLLQRKNPSWLYSVDQGATTIWERWDSYRKDIGFGRASMNSFNHYAYGAVMSWMYGTMAGIQEDTKNPGFKHFILAPVPDKRIGKVNCVFKSPYGDITSAWKYEADGTWKWNIIIPPNTSATVKLPGGKEEEFLSGSYEFALKLEK